MKVLVDTSVWSLVFRRNNAAVTGEHVKKLTALLMNSLVVVIGPIRQELLSGISQESVFTDLKARLECFDDFPISTRDYETAASFYNICRKNGIQGSHTDFLICSVAAGNDFLIYTTDNDFPRYAQHLPIRLFE